MINLIAFCMVIILLVSDRNRRGEGIIRRLFRQLLFCISAVLVLDTVGWQLDGLVYPGSRVVLLLCNTVTYFVEIVYCYLWIIYADYWVFESIPRLKKRQFAYALPALLQIILLITNFFTEWCFYIDASGRHTRGAYFNHYLATYVVYIILTSLNVLSGYRQQKSKKRKYQILCLALFMVLPACGVLLQSLFYGYSLVAPFITLSLLLTYLNVQQRQMHDREIESEQQKNEAFQRQVDIMMSRIQPHFLFNALNVIAYQCEVKTEGSEKTVENFARYLRGNFSSVNQHQPVPFTAEMEHLKSYLYIEKLRFPDLQFEMKLEITDFVLPVLTVQPLVECAVRYGATRRIGGNGTVSIQTREDRKNVYLSVSDNGDGYNPEIVQYDGHSGVGIADTRERIENQCHGTLETLCKPHIGSVVTITLPKNYQNLPL